VKKAPFKTPAFCLGLSRPLLALLVFPFTGSAAVINISPVADTRITTLGADGNSGAGPDFVVGTQGDRAGGALNRALIRFRIAESLPAGAIVQDARLSLNITHQPITPESSNFELHRMLIAWEELEATWNIARADSPWSAPGGVAGADFSATASSSQFVGTTPGLVSFANLGREVQDWLDHPDSNFGWIILTDAEDTRFTARRINSREGSPSPTLEINFTLPLRINSIFASGDLITLSFSAVANAAYVVQWTDQLDNPDWQELTRFDPNDQDSTIEVSDSSSNGPQRFYRVCQVPASP